MLIGKIEQEISKLIARLSDIISSSKKPLIVFKGVDRMLLEEYQAQYFCQGMDTFPIDKADFNECSRRMGFILSIIIYQTLKAAIRRSS